jgi:tetratricopeptide (TPR) repeat protein
MYLLGRMLLLSCALSVLVFQERARTQDRVMESLFSTTTLEECTVVVPDDGWALRLPGIPLPIRSRPKQIATYDNTDLSAAIYLLYEPIYVGSLDEGNIQEAADEYIGDYLEDMAGLKELKASSPDLYVELERSSIQTSDTMIGGRRTFMWQYDYIAADRRWKSSLFVFVLPGVKGLFALGLCTGAGSSSGEDATFRDAMQMLKSLKPVQRDILDEAVDRASGFSGAIAHWRKFRTPEVVRRRTTAARAALIADLEKARETHPNDYRVYDQLGRMYLLNDEASRFGAGYDANEAAANFLKALSCNPDAQWEYGNIGRCYFDLKKYNEAIEYLKEDVKRFPDASAKWCTLGEAYQAKGLLDDALRCFKRSLELAEKGGGTAGQFRRMLQERIQSIEIR